MEFPNWFNYTAKENFEKFLIPLAGQQNLYFLQLGVYTGDASVWLLNNVLTGAGTLLLDVDTWEGSDEDAHKSISFSAVYELYKKRMEPYDNLRSVRNNTYNFLLSNKERNNLFDFIYIDADHTTVGVLMDAELSFPLLKSGGIMAFDDYTWGAEMPPHLTPALGIDLFLERHEGEYETLVINSQVWIKKI
jgi:predicted O-methyltransferase YrrM